MQAKEYTIVVAESPDLLIGKVNAQIKAGWQPIGGVSSVVIQPARPEENGLAISQQAMIKS
jgi:hypothetical protein